MSQRSCQAQESYNQDPSRCGRPKPLSPMSVRGQRGIHDANLCECQPSSTRCGADMYEQFSKIGQSAGTVSQQFTDRLVCLDRDRDRGCYRLNSNVTLLIMPASLKGAECGQAMGLPSPIRMSAPPVRRKRYWPAFGHLYRGGSSRCDGSIASQIIVASKHECGN